LAEVTQKGKELTQREYLRIRKQLRAHSGTLDNLVAANIPDNQIPDAHDEKENGKECDPHLLGGHVRIEEFAAIFAESLDFALFFRESAHHSHARQTVAHRGGQPAM
jgi:hypothetical protein